MASLNRATLLGNLGSDPEIKNAGGTRLALLSLATTYSWTNKAGEKQDSTQWHRIKAFAKQAEFAEAFLHKGDTVLIEGSIETRSYDDKDGVKRYVTEIRAQRIQSVRSKRPGDNATHDTPTTRAAAASYSAEFSEGDTIF